SGVLRRLDPTDERQLAIIMRDIHAVADHEDIRTSKADEVGLDGDGSLARLFQHRADENAPRAARREQVLGESERAARFENIVDQENVAVANRRVDVAQDPDVSARHRAVKVARQVKELDLRLETRAMQGAQKIGRE